MSPRLEVAFDADHVARFGSELCIGEGLTFQDLGEVALKGFAQPIRVHALQHTS
jgi:class 3 adenylate cyclase